MTTGQSQRAKVLGERLLAAGAPAATLLERLRAQHCAAALDGAFDPALDDLTVLGEALLAKGRAAPPVDGRPNRRQHPRYVQDPPIPVLFAHPELGRPIEGWIADVGYGGARLEAPPTARPVLRWADPVSLVALHADPPHPAGLGGLSLAGYVVRIAIDWTGCVVNVRFDRTMGDWGRFDRWLDDLPP